MESLPMPIVRIAKHHHNYIIIDQTGLQDDRLSFRARGILSYLLTQVDDWQIRLDHIAKNSPKEKREAIAGALQELEKYGYAKKTRIRHGTGRLAGWETTIFERPETTEVGKTEVGKTEVGKTEVGKTEVGKTEVGKTEVGKTEVGASSITTPENDSGVTHTEIGSTEVGKSPCITRTAEKPKTKEKPEKKDPPIVPPSIKKATSSSAAHAVLAYLNQIHGRSFENPSQIQTLLATGVTVEDCRLVIDWLFQVERLTNPEGYQKYADNVTPFRPLNFDRNREKARRWRQQHTNATEHHEFKPFKVAL